MIPKRKEIDPRANENRFLNSPCLLTLPQARFPGTDDGLGTVGNLQLGEDVGHIVAYRLGAQRQLPGDRRVGVPLGDKVRILRSRSVSVGKAWGGAPPGEEAAK